MSDDGLPAAVARVMEVLGCERVTDDADDHPRAKWYCREHYDAANWTGEHCPIAEAVARAAREDVAETVREAEARGWDRGFDYGWLMACDVLPSDEAHDANPYRAAAIRAGEA